MTDDILGDIVAEELEKAENYRQRQLTEARAAIAKLREALEPFAKHFDKHDYIYSRRGGDHARYSDTHPSFEVGADEIRLGKWRDASKALTATPADCLKQIRAEVLEEAAQSIERKMQSAHHDFTSWQARNLIRALKDKP